VTLLRHPICPKCQAAMKLASLSNDDGGFQVRSFECPTCEHVLTDLSRTIRPRPHEEETALTL
jgi:Zn ribbon nucleic-acid-binding protein